MPAPALDIPYTAPNTLAGMPKTHAHVQITPNGDQTLSFGVALPKDWAYAKQFGPVPDGMFENRGLCFFAGSDEPGAPVVAVTVTTLPFELPVDEWARVSLATDDWRVVSGRWFPGPNNLFYDVTGVRTVDDMELVRRTTARVDGGRVFFVNTMCARKHWDAAKEDFWTAHVTFALLGGSGSTQMETWMRAATTKPDFETAHPLSWSHERAESKSGNLSAIHIRLTDAEESKLFAYLVIRAQRRSSSDDASLVWLLDDTLSMLERSGLMQTSGPTRLSEDDDPRSSGIEGWLGGYVGEGRVQEAELTYRLGFIARRDVVFELAMYCPKRQDDLLIALRAWRAFEIGRGALELL